MNSLNLLSQEALTAWIGVLGTLFGTIIGGIISFLIANKTIQKQKEIEENREIEMNKKVKIHLDNYLEYSFGCLFSMMPGPNKEYHPSKDTLISELNLFRIVIREFNNLPLSMMSSRVYQILVNVKLLLHILDVEVERVICSSDTPKEVTENLNKIDIRRRTTKIIEHYSEISDDKEFWMNLIKDIEERYEQTQSMQASGLN
ncbi:hypothetical protein J31TS4_38720 [Paenibacillus sp. J31TS4]|uniref:hypothetical protein n=1 Tax=Paenibacillus sp. J31TS4 TaxID=2807195 RepID=UPI001B1119E5|nr:hypothetical protein [Paenibacillus sp. J31TS4]GIP40592.1 hypothetical protein J31TS4_38720 [Paenibacillus sp. J31TS4]